MTSNRNWFVTVAGRSSRIVHEKVFALVTLAGPSDTSVLTGTPATFSGSVSPNHAGEPILLQRQRASGGDDWHTIDRARIHADGSFTIVHRFRVPGDANIRAVFPGDRRNLRSPSSVLSLQIEQTQHPNLTVLASANPLDEGQSVTLTGSVAGVTSPQPVTLFARTARTGFAPVAETMSDAAGAYSFTQTPVVNSFYRVRADQRWSAVLFEGVRDVVAASADRTTVTAGDTITFTGTVSPDETGHIIWLQRQNANGDDWHNVQRSRVGAGSGFMIADRVVAPGTKVFRILIPGGPDNQRGVSAPITVAVNPNSTPLSR